MGFFPLFFLIPLLISAEIDPDLETSLKDDSIPIIGFRWLSYHSKEDFGGRNWINCSFCLGNNCPIVKFISEPLPPNDTQPLIIFYPCPASLFWINENIKNDKLNKQFKERFSSEFTSISNKGQIRTIHRTWMFPDKEEVGERGPEDYPPNADVTLGRLVLKNAKTDLKTDAMDYEHPTGSEKTWVEYSCKNPRRWLSITSGESEDGHKVRETSSFWDAKPYLDRHTLFSNMAEFEEFKEKGCQCIRLRYPTYDDVPSQLVKECRKSLNLKREFLRVHLKLSLCLKKEERRELIHRSKNEL